MSIVIPALNEERYIGALLDSLEKQTYDHDRIEVLVADGGSQDRTREIVRERQALSTLQRLALLDNIGRTAAHGLNIGAASAKGEVLIILGAHAEVDRRFIEENVRALHETGAAAVGGPISTEGDGPVAAAIAAAMSHPFGVGDARFRFATEPGYVDTIAFAAYRRECLEIAGMFETRRDKIVDDLFNYRVREAGGRLYLTPRIRSTYYSRAGFKAVARQYFGYGKGKGTTLLDEPRALRPRHLVPLITLLVGGALAVGSLASNSLRVVFAGTAATYAALAALSALNAARTRGDIRLAPVTGLVFPVLHLSYGAGMLVALGQRALRRDG